MYEELVVNVIHKWPEAPSKSVHRRAFITTFAFSALFGVSLYYFITYANNHLVTTVGLPRSNALWLCSIALAVYVTFNPLIGWSKTAIGDASCCSVLLPHSLYWPIHLSCCSTPATQWQSS